MVRGLEPPPLTWQNFCWYFNHTKCVKIQYFQPKILKIFWGRAQPPPQWGEGTPSPHSTLLGARPPLCWNPGYATVEIESPVMRLNRNVSICELETSPSIYYTLNIDDQCISRSQRPRCLWLTHWRSHGDLGVRTSPLFENMGLVIRPNLHRYSEGWGRTVLAIPTVEKVSKSSPTFIWKCDCRPIVIFNCISNSPPIPNSFFLGKSKARTPRQTCAYGARERPLW